MPVSSGCLTMCHPRTRLPLSHIFGNKTMTVAPRPCNYRRTDFLPETQDWRFLCSQRKFFFSTLLSAAKNQKQDRLPACTPLARLRSEVQLCCRSCTFLSITYDRHCGHMLRPRRMCSRRGRQVEALAACSSRSDWGRRWCLEASRDIGSDESWRCSCSVMSSRSF